MHAFALAGCEGWGTLGLPFVYRGSVGESCGRRNWGDMKDTEHASKTGVSRRTVTKAMAWAGPAIAVAATVPVAAASLRKDPGINGWVLNSVQPLGRCQYRLTVTSTPSDPPTTPDGAPFGLYVYDVEDQNVISQAKITYWVIGNRPASGGGALTWETRPGHSPCWSGPVRVGTEVKPDGITYTGYRWTYECAIDPTNRTLGSDGVERLFLGDFHVRTSLTGQDCDNVTYWTQRHITIDPDGTGSLPAQVYTFQRRNGSLGPMAAGARSARSASPRVAAGGESSGLS